MGEDRLRQLIEPWLEAESLELDDLEFVGSGRARVLRILVDAEGGVDVDRLADVSQGLSRVLDQDPSLTDSYQLEVSSPGLERRLRDPRHYIKSVGREIRAKVETPEGTRTLSGILVGADYDGILLEVEGTEMNLGYEDIVTARTVFRWEPSPKPGKK